MHFSAPKNLEAFFALRASRNETETVQEAFSSFPLAIKHLIEDSQVTTTVLSLEI